MDRSRLLIQRMAARARWRIDRYGTALPTLHGLTPMPMPTAATMYPKYAPDEPTDEDVKALLECMNHTDLFYLMQAGGDRVKAKQMARDDWNEKVRLHRLEGISFDDDFFLRCRGSKFESK